MYIEQIKAIEKAKRRRKHMSTLWGHRAQTFIDEWTEYFKSKGWTDEKINYMLKDKDRLATELYQYWNKRAGSPI